ncbi:MAG: FAD-linked oxidase [Candidatus Tectimicrobiota bacterium]|nr:MAG: FAD-linked oxidase [Candidatus Tectomicrobia bacterium]
MSLTPSVLARLEALVGAERVRTAAACTARFAIGEVPPAAVVEPATLEEAAAVVAFAGREGLALVPWGQGTQMHLGGLPRRYDLALSLAALQRLVEYDAANLTLTAEAGLPLREVYRATLPQRQFLPLGFPGTAASLGGLLVTNTSGVKRLRYGSLRDLVLGVRVALPDGALVRFGGRVVKNVAGYDMNKLFIGSLGAFGVVLEATYRLAALPEENQALVAIFPALAAAAAAAAAVRRSPLLPSALLLLDAAAAATCPPLQSLPIRDGEVLWVLDVDGTHEAVARQLRDGKAICETHGARETAVLGGEALLALWAWGEAWRAPQANAAERFGLRLGLLPSALATTLPQLPAPPGGRLAWLADYPHGQVLAHVALPEAVSAPQVQAWLQQVRTAVSAQAGYCVVEHAPAALRRQLDLWGEVRGASLLRRYKQQFDPQGVLNPGRTAADL